MPRPWTGFWRCCADDQPAVRCAGVASLRLYGYAQGHGRAGHALAQQVLEADPFSGALFAFRGKRGGLIKRLWYDGQSLCLFSKRLEKGHFVWPVTPTGRVLLTPAQLSMLLEGIEWRMPQRTPRPELAG